MPSSRARLSDCSKMPRLSCAAGKASKIFLPTTACADVFADSRKAWFNATIAKSLSITKSGVGKQLNIVSKSGFAGGATVQLQETNYQSCHIMPPDGLCALRLLACATAASCLRDGALAPECVKRNASRPLWPAWRKVADTRTGTATHAAVTGISGFALQLQATRLRPT